ncbi:MAG: IscS subfamily cysteine desulfurase [Planctomycetaceae bacterium]|jgi:cysteine desulfurase|nr:IscS subfamily cysteine desulfurase [Phycisphaerales bacterium]MCE2653005.1 IscS subfamily cysteine desulfurase [Planctomycetaceae bacterium]
MSLKLPVYMDHAATTPCDPRVVEAMLPYFTERFGNSGSRNHRFGWEAEEGVDWAREMAAKLIGSTDKEILFTSGSTESNNLAIKGAAYMYEKAPAGSKNRGHIITAIHEHKAVLDPVKRLVKEGFEATFLEPGEDGLITAEMIAKALRPDTILVTIMWANNEIGTINEIPAIGKLCHEKGVLLHTDATQWVGKMPTNVETDNIDLMSWSGHKMYGPKGVGALYVRRHRPRVRLQALQDGGGQERGFRSGTLNVAGIVGFGKACEIAMNEMAADAIRLGRLRKKLEDALTAQIDVSKINGHLEKRLPHITNISFGFVEGEGLMMAVKNIACSSGSACTSASLEPSYVLKALGVGDELAHSSLRLSLGKWTTEEQVDYAIGEITKAVKKLREMSPLYDMHKEGIDLSKVEWAHH